ncbi:MAG: alpha/beta fold hydrolase, partial [Propionibacteriales bacterium]|nr:alpha/beta fold hydrolase [Propionibacteriales bacterium]
MHQDTEERAKLPNGIDICYDTFGDRDLPALLLIMGLGGPMTWWSPDLCRLLAERGLFVIRYDNRDVGKSTKLRGVGGRRSDVIKTFVRPAIPPPYTLNDMAGDGVGLLDHLAIDKAHVTGVSMGGMIAQTLAIDFPDRVLSLVSIMSTTGRRSVGWQD